LNEAAVINGIHIRVFAFHADLDPLGGPDTHTFGLQFLQMDTLGPVMEDIGVFFGGIFLIPEKSVGPLQGNASGFFFDHNYYLDLIIPQLAAKRKMETY